MYEKNNKEKKTKEEFEADPKLLSIILTKFYHCTGIPDKDKVRKMVRFHWQKKHPISPLQMHIFFALLLVGAGVGTAMGGPEMGPSLSSTELTMLNPCQPINPRNIQAALLSGLLNKFNWLDKYDAAKSKGKKMPKNAQKCPKYSPFFLFPVFFIGDATDPARLVLDTGHRRLRASSEEAAFFFRLQCSPCKRGGGGGRIGDGTGAGRAGGAGGCGEEAKAEEEAVKHEEEEERQENSDVLKILVILNMLKIGEFL